MQDKNNTTFILFLGSLKVFLVLKPPIHERNWKKSNKNIYVLKKYFTLYKIANDIWNFNLA